MKNPLDKLIQRTWAIHWRNSMRPYALEGAIPILFFGDLRRYNESTLKMITVGLNPSIAEFPRERPLLRFPRLAQLLPTWSKKLDPTARAEYREALTEYFMQEPYSWFDRSYETVLNGMNASYHEPERRFTALHTDFCSPLATRGDWGALTDSQKTSLMRDGNPLWYDLVQVLSPDVIIASIHRTLVQLIANHYEWESAPSKICDVRNRKGGGKRASNYEVTMWRLKLNGSTTVLVHGRAAQLPFGSLSTLDKRKIGREIVSKLAP